MGETTPLRPSSLAAHALHSFLLVSYITSPPRTVPRYGSIHPSIHPIPWDNHNCSNQSSRVRVPTHSQCPRLPRCLSYLLFLRFATLCFSTSFFVCFTTKLIRVGSSSEVTRRRKHTSGGTKRNNFYSTQIPRPFEQTWAIIAIKYKLLPKAISYLWADRKREFPSLPRKPNNEGTGGRKKWKKCCT